MPTYPFLHPQLTEQELIDSFGGYDHRLRIADGAWFDTRNLTSDCAPALASRPKRGYTHVRAAALGEKGALVHVTEDGTLCVNFQPTGLTGLSAGDKQIVGIGAFLVIFPDKLYYNTENPNDRGSLEAHYAPGGASCSPCRLDGTAFAADYIQSAEPPAPLNGQYWVDSSGERSVLRQWSEAQASWVTVESSYIKLVFPTLGVVPALFRVHDGVTISGAALDTLNGDRTIAALGGGENEQDWIIVPGLLEQGGEIGALHIDRCVPELDYVCECRNRLWGCRYGLSGGRVVNEICCCALGDFKNWRQFRGLSTDSWVASVGSDGQWTGAVNYLGQPCFFKENRIHRVSVSAEGAHRVDETVCRGVQKGSARSLCVVNETLYYKSAGEVCAYQGGFPSAVSAALGPKSYHAAVGGAVGGKYYLSMLDENEQSALFVYDIARALWLREDELRVTAFARVGSELYALAGGEIVALRGSLPLAGATAEQSIEWSAVSGVRGYALPENKRVSRWLLRMKLAPGASVSAFVQYDSDGLWRSAGQISAADGGTDSFLFPIRPRRCDHWQLKLTGVGEARLFSIAQILELGSDYR